MATVTPEGTALLTAIGLEKLAERLDLLAEAAKGKGLAGLTRKIDAEAANARKAAKALQAAFGEG